jgi:uncharacterized protein
MEIVTALVIGLAGSFHCIGMCGPIAVALPVPNGKNSGFITGRVLYNVGRILTYMLMGAVLGILGGKIVIAGYQQGLSITLGIIILLVVITPIKYRNIVLGYPIITRLISPLKQRITSLFKQNSYQSLFLIGVLNGFLPCGLVYIALAGAAASGTAINGMLFMMFFGIGTAPAILSASLFGKFISLNIRQKIRRMVPVFAALLAIIFILRGLNLGIPYLSPKLNAAPTEESCCH